MARSFRMQATSATFWCFPFSFSRSKSAHITRRYYEWSVDTRATNDSYQNQPEILDQQAIAMRYFAFRLGLRYELF